MNSNSWKLPLAAALAILLCLVGWEIASLMAAELHPQLRGGAVIEVLGRFVYWPWQWVIWLADGVELAGAELVGYGSMGTALAFVLVARLSLPRKQSDAYGSARWATERELERAGLGRDGVVLCQSADAKYDLREQGGKYRWIQRRHGRLLADEGDGHVLCAAPTRSGKGVGLVIPTLLTWRHSALIYDIKKELWHFTAGHRRRFSYCWRFEPTDPNSLRYNPLFEVPRGDGDVRQAQNIADILIDPNGTDERRDHWQKTACDLLVGAILHVLYAGKRKSLAGVLELLSDPAKDHEQILRAMMSAKHLGDRPHPQVVACARGVLNKHENERSGVFSTALSCLGIFLDPIVARNTDESDFRPSQLNSLDRPVSLYLVVPPSDAARLRPLVRLMLNQIGKRLTESMSHAPVQHKRVSLLARLRNALLPPASNAGSKRHRLLFLIDEFPTLGRLPLFEDALAFAAGYGIKFCLIAQSLNQIERVYGPNHSFLDNSAIRIVYAANDERTAKRISDMLGQRTEVQHRTTRSRRGGVAESTSESSSEHGRPLLTPGEVLTLRFDEALVFTNGAAPYRAKKIMYYQDERFAHRAALPTPDSPEAQAAELPPVLASDWSGIANPPVVQAAAGAADEQGGAAVGGNAAMSGIAGSADPSTLATVVFAGVDALAEQGEDGEQDDEGSDGRECVEEAAW